MKPFEQDEFPTPSFVGSERFLAFMQSLRDALIPRAGPATSVQGELLRANDRVTSELRRLDPASQGVLHPARDRLVGPERRTGH